MARRIRIALIVLAATMAGINLGVAYGQVQTGRLHLTFTERSPLSNLDEVLRRIDATDLARKQAEADKASLEYDLARESFEAFVPPTYKPDGSYGLFLWTGVADIPAAWQGVFTRHKLIWISANNIANRQGFLRVRLPLDALHNMKKLYRIDENRIYVAGFSAGAGLATHLVCAFPEVFRGGCFFMGGTFYRSHQMDNGQWEPTVEWMTPKWKGPLDQIKKEMRLVLIRGEDDTLYTLREGRGQYQGLLLDGFTRATYIEVPRVAHELPNASWFEKGIIALDQSKPKTPPTTSPTTQPNPLPSQIAQAQRLLATAEALLDIRNKPTPARKEKAREYLRQVVEEYPTTPAGSRARQLLDTK
jgi:predicted esterase